MADDTYRVMPVSRLRPVLVRVPGSKSLTNRALLMAALAEGESMLTGVLFSDDSRHFLGALEALGFSVEADEENAQVRLTGCGGRIPKERAEINVGSAGTAARFLTALLALSSGCCRIDASPQMRKRPMEELITSLGTLGAEFIFEEEPGHFPFTVRGRGYGRTAEKGEVSGPVRVSVNVEKSSQFLSALLMVSVLFEEGLEIGVTGDHGMAYVDMTIRLMEQFGVRAETLASEDGSFSAVYRVGAGSQYRAGSLQVEPDLSAACYFYGAGMLLGVPAKVLGVYRDSLQGDLSFLKVMEDMGGRIREEEDGICLLPAWLRPPAGQELTAGDEFVAEPRPVRFHIPEDKKGGWDLSAFSDQALTLAALAPFADAPVIIKGIGHIRYQECDRLSAIVENLSAMGITCVEEDGTLTIFPPEREGQLHGAFIHTHQDHRVAMAFAIPGLLLEGQVIQDPACCGKTFENFFEVLEQL